VAGNRPWMRPGEKHPPADRKCKTLIVMLTVPSGVRAWRVCQRVKDREPGRSRSVKTPV
jgi:hypothetical protein